MELKRRSVAKDFYPERLLIVPYGIETELDFSGLDDMIGF